MSYTVFLPLNTPTRGIRAARRRGQSSTGIAISVVPRQTAHRPARDSGVTRGKD